jgi:hypothetical protein
MEHYLIIEEVTKQITKDRTIAERCLHCLEMEYPLGVFKIIKRKE